MIFVLHPLPHFSSLSPTPQIFPPPSGKQYRPLWEPMIQDFCSDQTTTLLVKKVWVVVFCSVALTEEVYNRSYILYGRKNFWWTVFFCLFFFPSQDMLLSNFKFYLRSKIRVGNTAMLFSKFNKRWITTGCKSFFFFLN